MRSMAPAAAADDEPIRLTSAPQRERYPSGMSFVHLGRVQLSMMDGPARAVFVRIAKELGGYIAATAIVTQASGFWAGTLRSVVTGIMVMSSTPSELRFHDNVEEVFEWLPERHLQVTGLQVDLERLKRVLAKAARSAMQ
jgi:hypothetical protein